jgi:hypothetical protein
MDNGLLGDFHLIFRGFGLPLKFAKCNYRRNDTAYTDNSEYQICPPKDFVMPCPRLRHLCNGEDQIEHCQKFQHDSEIVLVKAEHADFKLGHCRCPLQIRASLGRAGRPWFRGGG